MILEIRSDLAETFLGSFSVPRPLVERAVLRHLGAFRDQDAETGPVLGSIRTLISIVSLPGGLRLRVWWFATSRGFGILHLGLRERDDEDAWDDDL